MKLINAVSLVSVACTITKVHVQEKETRLYKRQINTFDGSRDLSSFTGFGTDSNRAGFNAFVPAEKTRVAKAKTIQGILVLTSTMAALFLSSPWGFLVSFVLQGGAFFVIPTPPNPAALYVALYGTIQNQINTVLNNNLVSDAVNTLNTLTHTINDQIISYMATLGIKDNTVQTMKGFADGSIPVPLVSPEQVQSSMMSIHNIMSASKWYSAFFSSNSSKSFVLTNAVGINPRFCLHTADFNNADGTSLKIDGECNLNSMDDKLFGISPTTGQLILRTNNGDKCVAYKNNGEDKTSGIIGVFDISLPECNKSQRPILVKKNKDQTISLYDGKSMLCSTLDGRLTTTQTYKKRGFLWIKHNKRDECINGNVLKFKTRIPVVLNDPNQGGTTSWSVTPPSSFDEIGVQLYYFPRLATIHLSSLKEMYLYGQGSVYAETSYKAYVLKYQTWLAAHILSFGLYAEFKDIDAGQAISEAKNLYDSLGKATLNSIQLSTSFDGSLS